MIEVRQKNQGRRLLLALTALLVVVPAVMVFFLVVGIFTLELAWGGEEAAWAVIMDWSRQSVYARNLVFLALLAVVALISIGVPVAIWHRIFVASGYVSKETQLDLERGILPGVGRYWQPLMLVCAIWLCFWDSHNNFKSSRYIDAVVYGLLGGAGACTRAVEHCSNG